MPTAVIVDAVRTPLGRRNGKLKDTHPVDLAAHTLQALVERNGLDPALVEDVIMGCVMQVGDQGVNVGRNAALAAGFPETVVGTSIDRQCGSSQQAAHFAAQGVIAGAYDVVIAAGVENMTRVPMGASVIPGQHAVRPEDDRALPGRGSCRRASRPSSSPRSGTSRREDNDRFSVESHQRAAQARPRRAASSGRSSRSTVTTEDGTRDCSRADEGIRPDSSIETLAKLKPAFKPDGVVTAANSSQITDGAAALLIMSEEKANELGLTPRARFHTFALAGVDPVIMLTGPIPATTQGARAGGDDARRDGPHRDQRGVRAGRARVGEGAPPRHEQGERERRRDRPRPPARLLRRPAHGHAAQRARAHRRPLRASRRCARAAAWRTPPSSSAWADGDRAGDRRTGPSSGAAMPSDPDRGRSPRVVLYLLGGAARARNVHGPGPPDEPDPATLRPVDFRYRCGVCGAEVTMTAAPGDEDPTPPRHCQEDMVLVGPRRCLIQGRRVVPSLWGTTALWEITRGEFVRLPPPMPPCEVRRLAVAGRRRSRPVIWTRPSEQVPVLLLAGQEPEVVGDDHERPQCRAGRTSSTGTHSCWLACFLGAGGV